MVEFGAFPWLVYKFDGFLRGIETKLVAVVFPSAVADLKSKREDDAGGDEEKRVRMVTL